MVIIYYKSRLSLVATKQFSSFWGFFFYLASNMGRVYSLYYLSKYLLTPSEWVRNKTELSTVSRHVEEGDGESKRSVEVLSKWRTYIFCKADRYEFPVTPVMLKR